METMGSQTRGTPKTPISSFKMPEIDTIGMESSENNTMRERSHPAILRRSCDQCRARKIGCGRGSPCSNCASAGLNCTHSAVAVKSTPPRQRVLISAQHERKIDSIAEGVNAIRGLLQQQTDRALFRTEGNSTASSIPIASDKSPLGEISRPVTSAEPRPWDYPAHILDFIKHVVEDSGLSSVGSEAFEVVSSLKNLIQSLEHTNSARDLSFPEVGSRDEKSPSSMPPFEAAVDVLRWARDHASQFIIELVCRVLPLDYITKICRNVYFAVNDYSEMDFILANAFLGYFFFEHALSSGNQDYRDYSSQCRKLFRSSISHLPLLVPPSMEVIAALLIGAFDAIENSKAKMAWTFISTASSMCQTLSYHRQSNPESKQRLHDTQESLFWSVYKIEKSLSLRLGRASTIRDSEITLPIAPDEPRFIRVGRIQGKVYDQLYSPEGLSRTCAERIAVAEALAMELKNLISEARLDNVDANSRSEADPMCLPHFNCEFITHGSLLVQVLRAIPSATEQCVDISREVFVAHQKMMVGTRGEGADPDMVKRYLHWSIMHAPFVPFSILFTHAVQYFDMADLSRLETFAASLKPLTGASESISHPYRLYNLLARTARLYFTANSPSLAMSSALTQNLSSSLTEFSNVGALHMPDGFALGPNYDLSEWYYDNQHVMNFLDNNTAL